MLSDIIDVLAPITSASDAIKSSIGQKSIFKIRVYGNHLDSSFERLDQKVRKYLERKKATEPTTNNGTITYQLRNGLVVDYSKSTSQLKMFVAGDSERVYKSISALEHHYKGYIHVDVLSLVE